MSGTEDPADASGLPGQDAELVAGGIGEHVFLADPEGNAYPRHRALTDVGVLRAEVEQALHDLLLPHTAGQVGMQPGR